MVTRDRFEHLVGEALDSLPEDLGRAMENVAVVVDGRAPGGNLFGLYEGIPLTKRANYGDLAVPDRITVYQDTICEHCTTEAEAIALVRRTVVHEVGHHFGISDSRLHALGWG